MKLFKKYILLPLILLITMIGNTNAQINYPEDKVSWEFSIEQNGCEATIVGKITMKEHWHVYAANLPEGSWLIPVEVEPKESSNYEVVGKIVEPKPEFYVDDITKDEIYQHSKTITLRRKIKISSTNDFTLKGRFSFQTCKEEVDGEAAFCLPPYDADFSIKIKGCGGVNSESGDAAVIEENDGPIEIGESQLVDINNDEAKDKEGTNCVKVNGKWYKVPLGNSLAFYKKYLMIGGVGHE